MFGFEGFAAVVLALIAPCFGLLVLYAIIRVAVHHGMADALHEAEAKRVRSELGVGKQRSPGQLP